MFLCVSVYVFIHYVCLCMSVCECVYLGVSVCVSVCLYVHKYVSLRAWVPVCAL